MNTNVFKRVNELATCHSIDELCRTFERHMCAYGFDKYALTGKTAPPTGQSAPIVLATYEKEWVDHYFDAGYDKIDPVIATSQHQLQPFLWSKAWNGQELTKQQNDFFEEAKDYGVAFGLGIPIKVMGRENANLSLVSSICDENEVQEIFQEKIFELALIGNYFHHAACHIMSHRKTDNKEVPYGLTQAEIDVLTWATRGKTYEETAMILGLTTSAVREYFRVIRRKMDVATTNQACFLAAISGVID